ncbi:MAG: SMC family ATPase [Caldisericaceae bacterium]
MIPEILKIKGFLSYNEEQTLDFRKFNLAVISGDNGHGKSSILDAIVFALFGVARSLKSDLKSVVNRNADELKIELIFKEKENIYRIRRKIGKEGKSQVILEQFDPVNESFKNISENTIRETDKKIENIINFTYDAFITSSFILQGQADYFTSKTPSEKVEVLRELINLGIFEKAKNVAKERRKNIEGRVEEIKNKIKDLEEHIKKEVEFTSELSKIQRELEANLLKEKVAKEQIGSLQKRLQEKEKLKTYIEGLNRNIEETLTQHRKKEEELNDINKNIEEYDKILQEKESIVENFEKLKKIREEKNILSIKEKEFIKLTSNQKNIERIIEDKNQHLIDKIESLSKKIKDTIKKKDTNVSEKEDIKKHLSEFESIKVKLEDNLKTSTELLNKKLTELALLKDRIASLRVLKVLFEQYLKEEQQRKNKEKEVKNIDNDIHDTTKQVEKLNKSIEDLENILLNEEPLLKTKKDNEQEIAKVKENIRIEQDKIDIIRRSSQPVCPVCGRELNEEHKHKIEEDTFKTITHLKERLVLVEEALKDSKKKFEDIEKSKIELNKKRIEKERLIERIESLKNKKREEEFELTQTNLNIESLENKIGNIEELQKVKIENLEKELSELQKEIENLNNTVQATREKLNELDRNILVDKTNLKNIEENFLTLQKTLEEDQKEYENLGGILKNKTHISNELEQLYKVKNEIEVLGFDEKYFIELTKKESELKVFEDKFSKLITAEATLKELKNTREKLLIELEDIKRKFESIKNEIVKNNEVLKNFESVENKLLEAQKEETEIQKEILELSNKKAVYEREISEIKQSKNTLQTLEQQLSLESERITVLSKIEEIFGRNGIQITILRQFLTVLEDEVNRFLLKLTDGRMHIQFKTITVDTTHSEKPTLEIYVYEGGSERRYELLSGGEQFRINFALRLGIARFISKLRSAPIEMLVIDEGFGSQDERGRNNIIQEINSIRDDFKKILLVSHLPEIKDNFAYEIKVTKDVNGSRIIQD